MNESKNTIIVVGKNSNINIKNFDTLDEFQNYYDLHKDEIDKLTTNKLNRMFKIKDYKIARRTIDNTETKKLCFRQLLKSELHPNDENSAEANENEILSVREIESINDTLSELNDRIKILELDNTKIKKQLLEIINALNTSS